MPYPPPVPPTTRADSTPAAGAHAADHNGLAAAVASLIAELGANPSGSYEDLTTRLGTVAVRSESGAWGALQRFTAQHYATQATELGVYPSTQGTTNAGIDLAVGTSAWRIDNNNGTLRFVQASVKNVASLTFDGRLGVPNVVTSKLGVGGEGSPRNPLPFAVTIDGSTFTSATPPGDKVAHALTVTARGSFTNEAAWGMGNPGFLWGANDFVISGSNAGDLAGLADFWSRLTEVHLNAPGATLNTLVGLEAEAAIGSTAVGAVVQSVFALRAVGPRIRGGTAVNAYGLWASQPTIEGAGAITGKRLAIRAEGPTELNGSLGVVGAFSAINAVAGDRFRVDAYVTPNVQATARGIYLGANAAQGPGIELSDGTRTARVDVTTDGKLRLLTAGVRVLAEWALASGSMLVKSGLEIEGALRLPTSLVQVAGTATGGAGVLPAAPVGFVVINLGGTDRKVPFYAV